MSAARVVLLTEIPAPFRIPLFNGLAAREDVDPLVLFLSRSDPRRPHYTVYEDEFRHRWRVLPGRQLERGGRWIVLSRGVIRALRRERPALVVVGGWNQPAFWQAALYARVTRTPLAAWVESTARDVRPGSLPLELAKRLLVASCSAFLVPGTASREYVRSLGVADDRIVTAPNAVDLGIFGRRVEELRPQRDELRTERGLTAPVVLYVGRLDPEKGVDVLLEAARDAAATFVLVGAGRDEERLRAAAPPNVRFVGTATREELPAWYALADAFVLPARSDQWGMVLNEAALAGLPLVATDAPGAAHDVIEDGVNGFRVPAGDAAALAAALRRALDPDFARRAGTRSREIGGRYTPEAWAAAVASVASLRTRPRAGRR